MAGNVSKASPLSKASGRGGFQSFVTSSVVNKTAAPTRLEPNSTGRLPVSSNQIPAAEKFSHNHFEKISPVLRLSEQTTFPAI